MEQCTLRLVTTLLFVALKAEENSLKSTVHGVHHREHLSLFNKFKGYNTGNTAVHFFIVQSHWCSNLCRIYLEIY